MDQLIDYLDQLTSAEGKRIIKEVLHLDPAEIALKKFSTLPASVVADQVKSRQKARKKLPAWWDNPDLVFPFHENLAQSSSALTAAYKSGESSGKTGADLTGGFGVDSYALAQNFDIWHFVEPDRELIRIAAHNFKVLGLHHVHFHHQDAASFLTEQAGFDFIYLDPSRRIEGKRVTDIREAVPDVYEMLPQLCRKGKRVLIKISPMDHLPDIQKHFPPHELHAVAVNNELKELLLDIYEGAGGKVICVDYQKKSCKEFMFNRQDRQKVILAEDVGDYLFEPGAAILKTAGQEHLATAFKLHKLDRHTHLYTSAKPPAEFLGRVFRVREVMNIDWSVLKKRFKKGRLHVVTRNFPDNADNISHRLQAIPGGNNYIIFCSVAGRHKAILAELEP